MWCHDHVLGTLCTALHCDRCGAAVVAASMLFGDLSVIVFRALTSCRPWRGIVMSSLVALAIQLMPAQPAHAARQYGCTVAMLMLENWWRPSRVRLRHTGSHAETLADAHCGSEFLAGRRDPRVSPSVLPILRSAHLCRAVGCARAREQRTRSTTRSRVPCQQARDAMHPGTVTMSLLSCRGCVSAGIGC